LLRSEYEAFCCAEDVCLVPGKGIFFLMCGEVLMSLQESKTQANARGTGWLPQDLQVQGGATGLVDALFEGNPNMVLVIGKDCRIAGANTRALTEYRYLRQEIEGQPLEMLLPVAGRDRHLGHMRKYMKHPAIGAMGSPMKLNTRDACGNEFPVDVMLWPLMEGGQSNYVIAICHRLDASLAQARTQIHALVENAREYAVNLVDAEGRILTWNEGSQRVYNLTGSEALGQHYSILFSPEEIAAGEPERQILEASQSLEPVLTAGWRTGAGNQQVWAEIEFKALRDPAGELNGFSRVLHDLTKHKRAEEELRAGNKALAESEQMFRLIIESVTDYAVYMLDPQGRVVTWNTGAERRKGYKKSEVLGKHFSIFFMREAVEAGVPEEELRAAVRDGRFETQAWRVRKDGSRFWALVSLTAIRGSEGELRGFAQVTRDLTQQKALEDAMAKVAVDLDERVIERTKQLEASVEELRTKNEEIEALVAMVSHDLNEKEVLLREVYHRVKNNLQVVQSLLKMGARTLRSLDARTAIETAVERVHVMAMVHEHLYQTPDLTGLTLATYLRDIVEGSIASNSERPERIQLEFDVDKIPVPLDYAIPLGLLANELVSNCLKHGIPRGGRGKILVSAHAHAESVRFTVQDDGAGLPEDFDAKKCTSMGLKLASSFCLQLGGVLQFSSSGGCSVAANLTRLMPREDTSTPSTMSKRLPPGTALRDLRQERGKAARSPREFSDPSYYLS
jgi:PAS domain S-box-containing protein